MLGLSRKLNVLVVGANGQLGSCLKQLLQDDSRRRDSLFGVVSGVDLPDVDISKAYPLEPWLDRSVADPPIRYHWVVNCAAITDTTKIETDKATSDLSYRVNVLGPKNIAEACAQHGVKLVHISTDYVFSEKSRCKAAASSMHPARIYEFPVNVYGLHKLLGEKMVEVAFAQKPRDFMILRTSWLYGNSEASFPVKFLKSCIGKKTAKVVDDCFGRPTSVQYLSRFIASAITEGAWGKIDAQSVSTPMSRFEFALHVLDRWRAYARRSRDLSCSQLAMAELKLIPCESFEFASEVQHPREMPITNSIFTPSMTTPDMAIDELRLQRIVEGTKVKTKSLEMYDQWLDDFGGSQMLEKALRSRCLQAT